MSEDLQALLDSCSVQALNRRKITQSTCQHWDYRVRVAPSGKAQHVAVYRDQDGSIMGAKVRDVETKEFFVVGELPPLYGMAQIGKGGKMIVLTEGEIDCLTVSQAFGNKWPVVSVPKGAPNAKKDVAKALDLLCRYDKVVICFDMDGPGIEAAQDVARMLPPGKAFICKLPMKDPNEMLLAGKVETLTGLLHNAAPFRPDGIVSGDDLDAKVMDPVVWGLTTGYDWLDQWTKGLRPGDVWCIGAGTGVGKSDLSAEIFAHLIAPKDDGGEYTPVALFNYESGATRSYKILLSKLASKRFNIPDPRDGTPNIYWTKEDLAAAVSYRREKCAQVFINDHKGAISWDSAKDRIRYLVHANGVRVVGIDPVAALAAMMEDERKGLDLMMAESKSLAEELGITIIWVSHLARPPEGKSHEEGGRVTLRNFRGSGAIVMWCSYILAMERDQQAEDPAVRAITVVRCLKDREFGDSTGATQGILYNVITGRLEDAVPSLMQPDGEAPPPIDDETDLGSYEA